MSCLTCFTMYDVKVCRSLMSRRGETGSELVFIGTVQPWAACETESWSSSSGLNVFLWQAGVLLFFFFFLKRVEGFGLFLCLVQLQLSLCTYQPWPRSVGSLTRPERAERCRKIGANTELGHKVEKRREEVGTDREFAVQDLYGGSCQLYFHDIW